jgi:hypothetical protein
MGVALHRYRATVRLVTEMLVEGRPGAAAGREYAAALAVRPRGGARSARRDDGAQRNRPRGWHTTRPVESTTERLRSRRGRHDARALRRGGDVSSENITMQPRLWMHRTLHNRGCARKRRGPWLYGLTPAERYCGSESNGNVIVQWTPERNLQVFCR